MRPIKLPEHGPFDQQDPWIHTKVSGTSSCTPPKCPACLLSKATARAPPNSTLSKRPQQAMKIRRKDMLPGKRVSIDNFDSRIPGRRPETQGKEAPQDKFVGGSLFVDHFSGFMWVHFQTSLSAAQAIQGKHGLERFAKQYGVKIKGYHADNHPFASEEFVTDLHSLDQSITYSAPGTHFQNGVVERAQQLVFANARAMMLHFLIHWPQGFSEDLWPFAVEQAVYLWNHLPRERGGPSPVELFTGAQLPHCDVVQQARVFGCPTFVLDPKLQDGHKLPKWKRKSRLGINLGASLSHAPTVARVLNLKTGYISPQYHTVFDEAFHTVPGGLTPEDFDDTLWKF